MPLGLRESCSGPGGGHGLDLLLLVQETQALRHRLDLGHRAAQLRLCVRPGSVGRLTLQELLFAGPFLQGLVPERWVVLEFLKGSCRLGLDASLMYVAIPGTSYPRITFSGSTMTFTRQTVPYQQAATYTIYYGVR